jgi:hypothetical protein
MGEPNMTLGSCMEHPIFAVWDFRWRPVGDAPSRRPIDELVPSEETDLEHPDKPGAYPSHFELYRAATPPCR